MPQRNLNKEKIQNANPLRRCDYTEFDVQSLRALARGTATPRQQKAALEFIIHDIADTYGNAMRTDERWATFALGKQHVGQSIVFFLNVAKVVTSADKIAVRELQDALNEQSEQTNESLA